MVRLRNPFRSRPESVDYGDYVDDDVLDEAAAREQVEKLQEVVDAHLGRGMEVYESALDFPASLGEKDREAALEAMKLLSEGKTADYVANGGYVLGHMSEADRERRRQTADKVEHLREHLEREVERVVDAYMADWGVAGYADKAEHRREAGVSDIPADLPSDLRHSLESAVFSNDGSGGPDWLSDEERRLLRDLMVPDGDKFTVDARVAYQLDSRNYDCFVTQDLMESVEQMRRECALVAGRVDGGWGVSEEEQRDASILLDYGISLAREDVDRALFWDAVASVSGNSGFLSDEKRQWLLAGSSELESRQRDLVADGVDSTDEGSYPAFCEPALAWSDRDGKTTLGWTVKEEDYGTYLAVKGWDVAERSSFYGDGGATELYLVSMDDGKGGLTYGMSTVSKRDFYGEIAGLRQTLDSQDEVYHRLSYGGAMSAPEVLMNRLDLHYGVKEIDVEKLADGGVEAWLDANGSGDPEVRESQRALLEKLAAEAAADRSEDYVPSYRELLADGDKRQVVDAERAAEADAPLSYRDELILREQERLKAEQERLATEQAEQERLREEAERLAAEQARQPLNYRELLFQRHQP